MRKIGKVPRGGKYLEVFLEDERRYWRERIHKPKGAWEEVRRLTQLMMKAKKVIVYRQLYPILYYGCEAFPHVIEEMRRLSK